MKKTLIHGLFISTLLLMPMGLMGVTTDSGSGMVKNNTTTTENSMSESMHSNTMKPSDNSMSKDHMTQPGNKTEQSSGSTTTVGWVRWGVGPRFYGGYYGYYPRSYYYNNWGYPYYGGYGYGYGWRGPYVYVG